MSDPMDEKRIPDGGMRLPDPGQLQPDDTLIGRGTDPSGADQDPLDKGYTEPDRLIDPERWLNEDETIEDRIREEEPDPASGYGPPTGSGIVGDERPGTTQDAGDPALRDPEVQAELDEIDEELRHNDG